MRCHYLCLCYCRPPPLPNFFPSESQEREEVTRKAPSRPPGKGIEIDAESKSPKDEEFEEAFRVFDLARYASPMTAPWSGRQAALGMIAWAASFIGVGLVLVPVIRSFAGPGGFAVLSQQQKALFTLLNQILETGAGLGIIGLATGVFGPEALPSDVLKIDFRSPFRKPDGWAAWGLLGILLSPAVVYAASLLIEKIGAEDLSARGTADAVSQLLALDTTTFLSLFITTAVLAPLLEETVFRGFLLPSLAKVMPTPAAVALSSVAFGLVHLSPRDTPQLTALGVLLGFSYVRSRNLLTPMMIHGTWNGTVLAVLYVLQATGVDLQELLHQGASQ